MSQTPDVLLPIIQLTHCGLVMPYGTEELGHYWFW